MSQLTPPPNPLVPDVGERPQRAPVLRSQLTPQPDEPRDGIPLQEYVRALRRYWWLAAAAMVIAAGLAVWRVL
ncbi:MAG TPA: hypothetical protein VFS20_22815, partial [Longimicrobium sp.]|nr:hypothetical protein [Longimicrobium sp.]